MVLRWQMHDPVLNVTQTFSMNPDKGGSPAYRKSFSSESTVGPNGSTLLYEGAPPIQTISFSGTILSDAQYIQFKNWFKKPYPLVLKDDLNREFTIVIAEFIPERVRSATLPYKHTYTLSYYVIGQKDLGDP